MNPFENPDYEFLALINDRGQYSLWPTFKSVPEGWRIAFGPAERSDCLNHIDENWADLRPEGG